MKILKTAKYKILEATFEGSVYSPANEDSWVNTLEEERSSHLSRRKYPSTGKNKARHRPSVLETVPVHSLPSARQDELKRDQLSNENMEEQMQRRIMFRDIADRTKQRGLDVKKWIYLVKGEEIRDKLYGLYNQAKKLGPAGDNINNLLYNASLGNENSLKELSFRIKEEITTEPGKIENPNFY